MLDPFFWASVSAALLVIGFLSYLRFYQKLLPNKTALVLALRLLVITFLFLSGLFHLLWPLPHEYWIVKGILWVAVVIFLCGLVELWFDRWSGRHEQSALIRLAGIIERLWLWKIDPKRREQYEWHGRWRLEVFFRRIHRWCENFDGDRDLANLRPLYVLAAAGTAYGLLCLALADSETTAWEWLNQTMTAKDSGGATMKLALLGMPIAFVIWWFRDNNNRHQIESQRKDINLKDFQKLAEWATGMHLPEDKVVTSEKFAAGNKEVTCSTETWSGISHNVLPTPSRREGAASLQIAAIYQLKAFVEGDYGRYFQRPAFQLLKSMWLAMVRDQLEEWESIDEVLLDKKHITVWCDDLRRVTNTPLGRAINNALGTTHGRVLRAHADDLPEAVFVGFEVMADELELDSLQELSLVGIDLRGAVLRGAKLQRTTLVIAKLQGADLSDAQLQGADLRNADLQGATLVGAKLQGANLFQVKLEGANLRSAQLQGADLSNARLEKAQLQGTSLIGAQLQGAALYNFGYDAKTSFHYCNTDTYTRVLVSVEKVVDTAATFALRKKLRDENGLILPDILYTQIFATDDRLAMEYKTHEA